MGSSIPVAKVVSGGQTGADRAALDAALRLGVAYGGWCPRGGLAEDLPRPPGLLARYPGLTEAPTPEPAERTRLNVRDSDGTLVLTRRPGRLTGGTALTVRIAEELGKPLLVVSPDTGAAAEEVRAWLARTGVRVLNVAGPRESKEPGLYDATTRVLERVLRPAHGADGAPS